MPFNVLTMVLHIGSYAFIAAPPAHEYLRVGHPCGLYPFPNGAVKAKLRRLVGSRRCIWDGVKCDKRILLLFTCPLYIYKYHCRLVYTYTNKGGRCRGFSIYESIIVMKTKHYTIIIRILVHEPEGGFCRKKQTGVGPGH